MVAKDKENDMKPVQLHANEIKESIILGIANVAQQCQKWRIRIHGKNIISGRRLQMEI